MNAHMHSTTTPMHTTHHDSSSHVTYFHAGRPYHYLFKPLLVQTTGAMVGACIVSFIGAFLIEGLKHMKYSLDEKLTTRERKVQVAYVFLQMLLHMLQVFFGYMMMLMVMTYDAWQAAALILGAGIGFATFTFLRLRLPVTVQAHQKSQEDTCCS